MLKTKIIALLAVTALPCLAQAHSTLMVGEAPADSYYLATVQIPHGCDGKATNEVQIKLPEGFINAKPQPKAGWEIEIIKGKYQKTYDNHGKPLSEGPLEIRWKNGNLPDEFYDNFVISGKISGIAPGATVPFITTQLCGSEGKIAWEQVAVEGQDPHSLKFPAPVLKITAAKDAHGAHAVADFAPVNLGTLSLTNGFVKAMTKGQPAGGGFITLANQGHEDDRLVAVEAKGFADHVELHEMAMNNDVMTMRMLKDGIVIPAGKSVELKPGGLHMMFMGVNEPFAEGSKVKVKLTFEKAGTIEVELPAKRINGAHQHKG